MSDWAEVAWRDLDELVEPTPAAASVAGEAPASQVDPVRLKQAIANLVDRAMAAGRAQGRQEALTQWKQEVDTALTSVRQELASFLVQQQQLLAQQEAIILDLVKAVVQRIVYAYVEDNPQVLLDILRGVAAERSARWLKIRVNPDYVPLISGWAGAGGAGGAGPVPVEGDPSLAVGDVIIETSEGRYDLRLASRLEVLFERLENEVAGI